jgi:multiple sugar transport system substrate-binding protein
MAPMRAAALEWSRLHPEIELKWEVRPGLSFAEQPLEEVTPYFDLISIDHPFVGSASATRCLVPLDELLPAEELSALAADAIGASHVSYEYDGHQWALATDAACMVSLVREDLLGPDSVPRTWDDVRELADEAPGRVSLSLEGANLICSFLSLCANAGAPVPATRDRFADAEAGLAALEWLSAIARNCEPAAHDAFIPEWMATSDTCVYCPLQFGYTNYSRPSFTGGRPVRFLDIPSAGSGPVGACLGGAGLAVSSSSAHPAEAAAFAAWVTGSQAQVDVVFPNGGQPGSRAAWLDPRLDAAAGGFFSDTLATIEAAVVRPTDPWWPPFQTRGGAVLERGLRAGDQPEAMLADLERLWQDCYTEFSE